eukprot:COSAG06_NODE_2650_length_6503_cov_60.120706_1_plen_157_part_00
MEAVGMIVDQIDRQVEMCLLCRVVHVVEEAVDTALARSGGIQSTAAVSCWTRASTAPMQMRRAAVAGHRLSPGDVDRSAPGCPCTAGTPRGGCARPTPVLGGGRQGHRDEHQMQRCAGTAVHHDPTVSANQSPVCSLASVSLPPTRNGAAPPVSRG